MTAKPLYAFKRPVLVTICLSFDHAASRVAQMVKRLPAMQETRFDPWVGKIPWRRKWQPTPVLLPGKFHGWRSLVGYSPQGHKELDTTEWLHLMTHHGKGSGQSFNCISPPWHINMGTSSHINMEAEKLKPLKLNFRDTGKFSESVVFQKLESTMV